MSNPQSIPALLVKSTPNQAAIVSRRRLLHVAAAASLAPLLAPFAPAARAADRPGHWRLAHGRLMTRWSHEVNPHNSLVEYPRPQMVRPAWRNLNGLWDYQITPKNQTQIPGNSGGPGGRQIMVPFGIESALSGVMHALQPNERLWYHRTFTVPQSWHEGRILLHFGAVDWEATIFINGQHLGSHRGGYDSFHFDITNHVKGPGPHRIDVSVWDPTDTYWQPHGKQTLHPGGASYTATSGIWRTVWLEGVGDSYIERLKMIPDVEDAANGILHLEVIGRTAPEIMHIEAIASDDSGPVAHVSGPIGQQLSPVVRQNLVKFFKARSAWVSNEFQMPIKHPKLWTPDSPFLYTLKVHLKDAHGKIVDTVDSYFAMRSVKVGHDAQGNTRPMLNGKPILLPGALDQGFWPDGVYTAPTDDALKFDIQFAKRLGLNTVRKHVKVECDRWYYWADKLGLIVFQDMPTGNDGNPQTDRPTSPEAAAQWHTEVRRHIEQLMNHPSVFCWIMFNEAFGGFNYLRNAHWAHRLDPSRFIDESSGFPWHGAGNVADNHGGISPKFPNKFGITSEDGGWGLGCPGHEWNAAKSWTYRSYNPKTGKTMDFLALKNKDKSARIPPVTPRSRAWMTHEVVGLLGGFLRHAPRTGQSGDFYCQIVDVETEMDGLISYDRAIPKVTVEAVARAIRGATPKLKAAT